MSSLMRLLTVIVCILAAAGLAGSQCIVRNHGIVAATPAVVTPTVVTPAVATVDYPSYGSSYDASATEIPKLREALAAQQARIAVLETARDSLTARLAVLEAKAGITPAASAASHTVAPRDSMEKPAPREAKKAPAAVAQGGLPALYARSCIACHQQGRKVSGGLALVDAAGKELAQPCEMRLEILRRANLVETEAEAMPPKAPNKALTDAEKVIYQRPTDEEAADLLEKLTRDTSKR